MTKVQPCECCGNCVSCHLQPVSENTPYARKLNRCDTCALCYVVGYWNGTEGLLPPGTAGLIDPVMVAELALNNYSGTEANKAIKARLLQEVREAQEVTKAEEVRDPAA